MWLLIIGAALAAAIWLWHWLKKPLTYWSDMGVRQTKPWLLLGDAWAVLFRQKGICDWSQEVYNLHPNERYVGWYNFRSPALFLRDPEMIKQIGIKDFDSFTDHAPLIDPEADPLWSKTLFSLTGTRWKEVRHTVSPTFTSSKMKSIFVLMVEAAENFVNYFNTKDEEIIELDMGDVSTRFTNDVIATTAFGVKVDSLQDQENTFYLMGKKITTLSGVINGLKFILIQALPKLFKLLKIPFLDPVASKYFRGVINETIKMREEQKIVRPDMINILLEAKTQPLEENADQKKPEGKPKRNVEISNEDIVSQAVLFFFAGFETVARTMCFGTYELALNKDVQDKLREEIRETAKKGKINYETLQEMSYMDMVLSEILRKWPPFPNIDRVCTKDYTIQPTNMDQQAVHIQEGFEVWFPIFALHRDPKYFPNPEKFDPERFSDERKGSVVPYSYIPFGVGPRICLGNRFALLEIKALLYHLLLNYEIVPTKKTPISIVFKKDILPNIEGGFWIGFKRLQS